MGVKLKYDSMTDAAAAQSAIRNYLEFLNASDIVFSVDQEMTCSVNWLSNGDPLMMSADASPYVEAWFQYKPWERSGATRPRFSDEVEKRLAIANFWYLLSDRWIPIFGPMIYQHTQLFRATEAEAFLVLQKARLREKR